MKNRNFLKNSIIALLPISLGLGVLLGVSRSSKVNHQAVETNATVGSYSRNHSTYYTSAFTHKVSSSQYGSSLLLTLHELMYDSHESYNTYGELWDYTINTDYDIDNPDNIILLYSRQSVDGSYATQTWNREHVWCKSRSGGLYPSINNNGKGAGADIHHLRPANSILNSTRNDIPYGIVSDHSASKRLDVTDCYYDSNNFEPADYIKGDVARILMYTYMHYSSEIQNGSGSYNGALSITNIVNKNTAQSAWDLLLDWNESDPVDYSEVVRNNAACVLTGNFNPFIDHPEFARMIWDDSTSQQAGLFFNSSYVEVSKNSTITNTASKYGYGTLSDSITYTSDNPEVATVNSNGVITGVSDGIARIKARATINGISKISYCFAKVGSGYAPKRDFTSQGIVYTPTSSSTVKKSATAASETVSFSNTYTTSGAHSQITKGNKATLTISNFSKTVSSIKVSMHSTSSGTSSKIDVTVGGQSYKSVSGTFASLNGGVNSMVFTPIDLTNSSASTKTGTIQIVVEATNGSTYLTNFIVDYSERSKTVATGITVSPNANTITPGEDLFLTTTFSPSSTTLKSVTWSSSNTSVAKVDYNGRVKAISFGNATITATAKDGSGVSGSATIIVANQAGGDTTPRVNSVTVSPKSVSLYRDGTYTQQLSATVSVSYGASQAVSWTSSNTNVATVSSSGLVTGKTAGTTTITVRSTFDNSQFDTCSVTVYSSTPTLTSISLSGYTTEYSVGDAFSFDGVCTATFSDSSASPVTPSSVTSPDMSVAGEKTITVSYTFGGNTRSAQYTISVLESVSPVSGSYTWDLSVVSYASASETQVSWDADCASMVADKYNSTTAANNYLPSTRSSSRFYANSKLTITPKTGYEITSVVYTATTTGYATEFSDSAWSNATASSTNSTVTITPTNGKAAFYAVIHGTTGGTSVVVNYNQASSKTLSSITLDTTNVKKSFNLNESFEYSGLVVTAHYSDSTTATVTPTNVSSPDMTTIGEKTITVTYATVSASYGIAVHYPGSTSTSQMIVSKSSSTHYVDGAVYLTGSDSSGTAECDAFTATQTKYGGTSSISYNLDEIHVYQNHRFTISPKTGYIISSVLIFASSSNDASRIGGAGLSNCSKTKNDTIVTLTPTSGTSALSFSNSFESSIQFLIVNFEEYTLSWDSPNIDVFSGETLTSTEVNSWSVADGTTTYTSAQLLIKLGEEIISLPYEWKAEDDGKTLKASVNGVYTPESEPIRVTQTINSVYAATISTWEHEITEKTWTEAGSQTISGKTWVQDCTIASGNGYWGYDGTKGQQFGSGSSPFSQLTLTSSAFSGTIYSVSVYTSGASGVTGNVLVSVGGTDYGSVKSVTSTNSEYTFNGKSSGEIVIKWTQTTSKALYLKKLVVEYSTGQIDIANNNSHIEAQRVAVKYAKAFNAAMATTQGCTTNLSSAWSVCSSAYTTFLSEAAALGSTEEEYAKNLLKYATVQYTDDSGEACIERMLKTYQVCVQKHGQTPFMSQLVELSNIDVRPLFDNIYKNNKIIVTVLVSFISVSVIGGYFFLKSRKKEEF